MFNTSDVLDIDCSDDAFLKKGTDGMTHAQQAANNSGSFKLLDLAKFLSVTSSLSFACHVEL